MSNLVKKMSSVLTLCLLSCVGLAGCGEQSSSISAAPSSSYSSSSSSVASSSSSSASSSISSYASSEEKKQDEIVILYTNDVHCAYETNMGYAGLASYKKEMLEKTDNVTLVDCGDAIQGSTIGVISKGKYIEQIMNEIGYDIAVPGNHEFDYGMDNLSSLIDSSKATYLGCNLKYTGEGTSPLNEVKPYKVIDYGGVSVGFVGVMTPYSVTSSTPGNFMDDQGNIVYDFYGGDDGTKFYKVVQDSIDSCKAEGADYVVCCTHLGDTSDFDPYSSVSLAKNTSGACAILDGHAHRVVSSYITDNKDGKSVVVSSTGTQFENFGKLVITPNGDVTTSLIEHYEKKDQDTLDLIDTIKENFAAEVDKKIGASEAKLSVTNSDGFRAVRNREVGIGDFCADAVRYMANSDVAVMNGGGIRADISQGDMSYGDVINVHPFGNSLCSAEVTGQQILDCLEVAYRKVETSQNDGTKALGENGGFLQVSGIKFDLDTSIPTPVVFGTDNIFKEISGERRMKNVQIEKDGSYSPIDVTKTYSFASYNYLIKNAGDGNSVLKGCDLLIDEGTVDYQVLIDFISEGLGGTIPSSYASAAGRINVL